MSASDGKPQQFDTAFANSFQLVDADSTGMAEFEFEIQEQYGNFLGIWVLLLLSRRTSS